MTKKEDIVQKCPFASKPVCVLIRVYNRIEDLNICIELIRKYWKKGSYYILIIGNGSQDGFLIKRRTWENADKIIELNTNSGHLTGNSQLLIEGLNHIPTICKFTLLLEADTWVFDDTILHKYINRLEITDSVWASSEWTSKHWSLGLDFAITKTDFIKNNKEIFRFTTYPESWVCNYLLEKKRAFIYIKENMPVHRPNSMGIFFKSPDGRIKSFPKAKMITHHIEDLKNGIITKKELFNICVGEKIFNLGNLKFIKRQNKKIMFLIYLIKIFPQLSMFRKKTKQKF